MDEIVPQKNPAATQNNGEPATIGGRPPVHLDAGGNTLEGLEAANAAPDPANRPKSDIADIVSSLHKEQQTPNLRTFESDAADAVQQHNLSSVSMAAAKIQQRPDTQTDATEQGGGFFKKALLILGAFLLIAGSLAAVGYAFIVVTSKKSIPLAPIIQNTLMSVDDIKTVTLTPNQTTLNAWLGEKDALTTENATIVQIKITPTGTTTPLDSQTFLADLGAKNMPAWFIRAIGPEYIVGFYHDTAGWDPFLVLSVASYDNAFAGMLQWETGLGTDLAPLYTQPTIAIATSTQTASSTPVTLSSLPSFSDAFIDNENSRLFAIPGQEPFLLYSFPTQNVLVITTSKAAVSEIFNRLLNRQFVH